MRNSLSLTVTLACLSLFAPICAAQTSKEQSSLPSDDSIVALTSEIKQLKSEIDVLKRQLAKVKDSGENFTAIKLPEIVASLSSKPQRFCQLKLTLLVHHLDREFVEKSLSKQESKIHSQITELMEQKTIGELRAQKQLPLKMAIQSIVETELKTECIVRITSLKIQ